jgi:hypothetical protein
MDRPLTNQGPKRLRTKLARNLYDIQPIDQSYEGLQRNMLRGDWYVT